MSIHRNATAPALAAASLLAATAHAQPVIDERFIEWTDDLLVATDATADAPLGVFDLGRVWATAEGTTVYLSFEMLGTTANLQSGPFQGGPQLWLNPSSGDELTIFFRERRVSTGTLNTPLDLQLNEIRWGDANIAYLPTVAADRYELRVDLATVGAQPGDTVDINFVNPTLAQSIAPGQTSDLSSPDALDNHITITLPASTTPPPPIPTTDRAPGTTLRIASLNTLAAGYLSASPTRTAQFDRLLKAAAADVYALQELNGDPATVAQRLADTDPLGNGAIWNVHTDPSNSAFGSDYIATTRPLIPVIDAPLTDRFAAAVIGDDPATATLVLSIHPKCCGHVGDSSDQLRIDEAENTSDFLARFRQGIITPELAPYANVPVVVIGDWNLVGSNTPREILTDPNGPALRHNVLLNLDGRDAITWRDLDGFGFAPGLLDLCTYSPQSLDATGGFVLDTQRLSPADLAALNLQAEDSTASDHLLLVADFRPAERAPDIDADNTVGPDDLFALLANFGNTGIDLPGDLDDDLDVDPNDLFGLLAAFGSSF